MGLTGAKRAVITDESTGDNVEIGLLSQESDFTLEGIGEEDLNGNQLWVEDQGELSLAFFDDDAMNVDQLKTWQRDRTLLTVVVIGISDYIFWDKPSTILVSEPNDFRPGSRNIRTLSMQARDGQQQIARSPGYELLDNEGNDLDGFIGYSATAEGVTARTLEGATFGAEDTFTWTIDGTDYVMETVTMNTLN